MNTFRATRKVARSAEEEEHSEQDYYNDRATGADKNLRPGANPAAGVCDCTGVGAMKAELPENEAERLNALRRYEILDTPPEPAFDRIAEMAANFFQVPMAGISLVDKDRVWFKSRVGIDVDQTARDAGLCPSAILSQSPPGATAIISGRDQNALIRGVKSLPQARSATR